MTQLPVTLVTGFLGAGKTTLLKHILETSSDRRFAVIENEFGDVGIDGSLMDGQCQLLFELNDGCVCCSVRDDLIEVFSELLTRHNELDHVLVETTGLADPGPVMRIFDLPMFRKSLRLEGVVTVVDAPHLEQSLNDVAACLEQITYADMLILNKVDRVSDAELERCKARLAELNPLAGLQLARFSRVAVDSILRLRQQGSSSLDSKQAVESHHHHHHHHDEDIRPLVLEFEGEINVRELDLWLGGLARRDDMTLLRMKGVLAVPGDHRRFVFNGVRSALDVWPDRAWGDEPRVCRIVMIGRSLRSHDLKEGFRSCVLPNQVKDASAD